MLGMYTERQKFQGVIKSTVSRADIRGKLMKFKAHMLLWTSKKFRLLWGQRRSTRIAIPKKLYPLKYL
jgi:hypothetical protein